MKLNRFFIIIFELLKIVLLRLNLISQCLFFKWIIILRKTINACFVLVIK